MKEGIVGWLVGIKKKKIM